MTSIVDALGICYPAYLKNFKSVRSEAIHKLAGVSKNSNRTNPQ